MSLSLANGNTRPLSLIRSGKRGREDVSKNDSDEEVEEEEEDGEEDDDEEDDDEEDDDEDDEDDDEDEEEDDEEDEEEDEGGYVKMIDGSDEDNDEEDEMDAMIRAASLAPLDEGQQLRSFYPALLLS